MLQRSSYSYTMVLEYLRKTNSFFTLRSIAILQSPPPAGQPVISRKPSSNDRIRF
jgi:hypothetical protein